MSFQRLTITLCALTLLVSILTFSQLEAQSCDYNIQASDTAALINAIIQANLSSNQTICLEAGTYSFAASYGQNEAGSYALPVIGTDMTIEGNGASLVASGSSTFDFIQVSSNYTLTLKDLDIIDRNILSYGNLAATHLSFSQADLYTYANTIADSLDFSASSRFFNSGVLNLSNSSFIDSSTPFTNQPGANATLSFVTFDNNFAYEGGAINNSGQLLVEDSILNNNRASNRGGAIYATEDFTIVRSQVTNNYSGQGGGAFFAYNNAIIIIQDSILTGNTSNAGAGLLYSMSSSAMINISNSCINNNSPGAISISSNPNAKFENNWWGSAFSPASGNQYSGHNIGTVDYTPYLTAPILGCAAPAVDARNQSFNISINQSLPVNIIVQEGIAPFSYTITANPNNGSLSGIAPDFTYQPDTDFTGNDSFTVEVTDATGSTDTALIIVNVAVQAAAHIIVDSTVQEVPALSNGNCSLGEAITAANTNEPVDNCAAGYADIADVISLPEGATFSFSLVDNNFGTGSNALPVISSAVIIYGNNAILERLAAAPNMRFFYLSSGSLSLENMSLRAGSANSGGAIYAAGTALSIKNVSFENNNASGNGGAIYGGNVTVDSSSFTNNSAYSYGGAVDLASSTISNSSFSGNSTSQTNLGGGGALALRGTNTITNSIISNNSAAYRGGAINQYGNGTSNLDNVQILNNTAPSGGGINVESATSIRVVVGNSCFVGNSGYDFQTMNNASGDVRQNWWGASDGPSGIASGHGEAIGGSNITYVPFLTAAPEGCPSLPPAAVNLSMTIPPNIAKNFSLQAIGGEVPYSYSILTQPNNGTLSGTAPNLSYTPNTGFYGSDSFSYQAIGAGGELSSVGSVSFNVQSTLSIASGSHNVVYNSSKSFTIYASGGVNPLSFTILTAPQHGTLSGTVPNLIYTPDTNYIGTDGLSIRVTDADMISKEATISFNVLAPLIVPEQRFFVTAGEPALEMILISGGKTPYAITVTQGSHSTASIIGTTSLYFTMNASYIGLDTVTLTVRDALGTSTTVNYYFSSGSPLQSVSQNITIPYQSSKALSIPIQGGLAPYTIDFEPIAGNLSFQGGYSYLYTAATGFSGSDLILYTVTDAAGFSTTSFIEMTVAEPLVLASASLYLNPDSPLNMNLQATGGLAPYQYSISANPLHGTITGTAPNLIYTPNAAYIGIDRFSVSVVDSLGTSVSATISLEVVAPVSVSDVSGLIAVLQNAYTTNRPATLILTAPEYLLTSVNNSSANGENGLPRIRSHIRIIGQAAILRRETSAASFRFFEVESSGYLELDNMTLRDARLITITSSFGGGAIFNQGRLTISNSHFLNNMANTNSNSLDARGGAIDSLGNLRISNSEFVANISNDVSPSSSRTTLGGTFVINGSNNTLTNVQVSDSYADMGGAIYLGQSAQLSISGSNFTNNRSMGIPNTSSKGGAIYLVVLAHLEIENSEFSANIADEGAAFYLNNHSYLSLTGSRILNHQKLAIFSRYSELYINQSLIQDNELGIRVINGLSNGQNAITVVNQSCIVGATGFALDASDSGGYGRPYINAQYNWWGAVDGPSGSGTGHGDSISPGVNFDYFLTTPPFACPVLDPVITASTVQTIEDLASNIVFTAQGGLPPYSFSNFSSPLHGEFVGTGETGVLLYIPDTDFVGQDPITYTVTDSVGGTAMGVLTIDVKPALRNETHQSTTAADTPFTVTLISTTGVSPYQFMNVGTVAHGILLGSGGSYTYIPDTDFAGTDSISYEVIDSLGNVAVQTMEIIVQPRPAPTITVNTTLDEFPFSVNGTCTFEEAITASRNNVAVDACTAGSATATDIIYLPAGLYQVNNYVDLPTNAIIRGDGINQTIIERLGNEIDMSIFHLPTTTKVTLELLTLRDGGNQTGHRFGGAVFLYSSAELTANRVLFLRNEANTRGGAVYGETNSKFNAYNSVFLGNYAYFDGGIFYGRSGSEITFINNAMRDNLTSYPNFAGIFSYRAKLIHNCYLDTRGITTTQPATILYNWGTGTQQLVEKPEICQSIEAQTLSIPAGDNAALVAAIESSNENLTTTASTIYLAPNSSYSLNTEQITSSVRIYAQGAEISTANGTIFSLNSTGNLKLYDATLSNSSSAIVNEGGSVNLQNVTLSANDSSDNLGVIVSTSGSLSLENTTLSGNITDASSAVIYVQNGTVNLSAVTVANNTGSGTALYQTGAGIVNVQQSLFANEIPNCSGTIISLGDNLSSDSSCLFSAAGDLNAANPELLPLADNGGLSFTHALAPSSPAIDTVEGTCLSLDQRGNARPQGNYCDIGAYETLASIALSAPPALNATPAGTYVSLIWADNNSSETAYEIQRLSSGAASWQTLTTLASNSMAYSDNIASLACESTIYYRIRALRTTDNSASAFSPIVTLTTPYCSLLAPQTLQAGTSQLTNTSFSFTVPQQTSHAALLLMVERSSNSGANWAEIAQRPAFTSSFVDYPLACGSTYQYRLRYYRAADNSYSPYSAPLSLTTLPCVVPDVSDFSLSQNADKLELHWTLANANLYYFYIDQSLDNGASWAHLVTLTGGVSSYTSAVGCDTLVIYRLRAINPANGSSSALSPSLSALIPCSPGDLSISPLSATVAELSWQDNSSHETAYRLERSASNSGIWTEIAQLPADSLSYTDSSIECEVDYLYRLSAIHNQANTISAYVFASLSETCQAALSLSASQGIGLEINLSWADVLNAETEYRLERSADAGTTWESAATFPGNSSSASTTAPDCERDYSYRLRGYRPGDGFSSAYSNVVSILSGNCIVPHSPLNPAGNALDHRRISLSWDDNNHSPTEYRIERYDAGARIWRQVAQVAPNIESFTDTGLFCNRSYRYRIMAYRSTDAAFSPYSSEISATTLACPPLAAPMSISGITAANYQSVSLLIPADTSGSYSEYLLERQSPYTGLWTEIARFSASTTGYTDNDLSCGTYYSYRLRAFRAEDNSYSPYSALSSFSTLACPSPNASSLVLYKDGQWLIQDGTEIININFGNSEAGWQPLIGDWNGDGVDGIALYKDGQFLFRNDIWGSSADYRLNFSNEAGWQAIAGDWNGDGIDSIGIYKDGVFILSNNTDSATIHYRFNFGTGQTGWIAIAGDWDGNGADSVGLYREGLWNLSNSVLNPQNNISFNFGPSQAGLLPITGDWDNDGIDTIGLYISGAWRLHNANAANAVDYSISFGQLTTAWIPLGAYHGEMTVTPVPDPTEIPVETETAIPTSVPEATIEATETPVRAEMTAEATEAAP